MKYRWASRYIIHCSAAQTLSSKNSVGKFTGRRWRFNSSPFHGGLPCPKPWGTLPGKTHCARLEGPMSGMRQLLKVWNRNWNKISESSDVLQTQYQNASFKLCPIPSHVKLKPVLLSTLPDLPRPWGSGTSQEMGLPLPNTEGPSSILSKRLPTSLLRSWVWIEWALLRLSELKLQQTDVPPPCLWQANVPSPKGSDLWFHEATGKMTLTVAKVQLLIRISAAARHSWKDCSISAFGEWSPKSVPAPPPLVLAISSVPEQACFVVRKEWGVRELQLSSADRFGDIYFPQHMQADCQTWIASRERD